MLVADPKLYLNAKVLLKAKAFTSLFEDTRIENHLLALDQDNQIIPHTYLGMIESTNSAPFLELQLPEKTCDSGFLFYANTWSGNFQHFLTELFPKVMDYVALMEEYPNQIPLLIPKTLYNNFVMDLLNLLKLGDNIIQLERNTVYGFKKLYSSSYIPNFKEVHAKLIAAFKFLRGKLPSMPDTANAQTKHRIYLARDSSRDDSYNNNNAGSARVILNEGELLNTLQLLGFGSCVLGTCSIAEKQSKLLGSEIVVSPIGANLFNLLFLSQPYPKTVVIIHSSTFKLQHYFIDIFTQVYSGAITFRSFEGQSISREVNSPYTVNAAEFSSALDDWLR